MGVNSNKQLVSFELFGKKCLVHSSDLVGVARDCGTVVHPDLPNAISALVHWSGKIYPVLNLNAWARAQENPKAPQPMFLFASVSVNGVPFNFAVRISGYLKVFVQTEYEFESGSPDESNFCFSGHFKNRNLPGEHHFLLSLNDLAKVFAVKIFENQESDGKKEKAA